MPMKDRDRARAYDRERYPREKAARRAGHLRRLYGISAEEYAFRFASQGYACAACGAEQPGTKLGWHTDHSHRGEDKHVRGILCHHCNIAMGMAKDDPAWLERLAEYARRTT